MLEHYAKSSSVTHYRESAPGRRLTVSPVFLLCLVVLALPLVFSRAVQAASASRPNVILIVTDDQGYGDVAAHGNTVIQTPNMDELYRQSVRLTNFHVDPTCSPTRSALMTGRYSTRTGVWHTIMGRSLMSPNEVTVAERFAAGGYRTGMFGKWHLGDNYPLRPQDQGFEETFYHKGGGVGQGPDYWGNNYFDDTYFRNGKPEAASGYCTDVWFENALAFVEKNREQPFFLYLATNAPHGPYLVDEKYSQPYVEQGVPATMAKFYGMITNIDENLGRLRERLRDWDLEENTILVFMTDNGTAAGVARRRGGDGWKGFNAGMRGTKGSEYDGGHRVPCFIHWPKGKLTGGRDVGQLTAHVDMLPTLTSLCKVAQEDGPPLDGADLSGLLNGDEDALGERTLFVHSQRIEYPEKWRKSAVMTSRWRLVNGKELYDILEDPGQQQDVAAEHGEVVEDLTGAYEGWWESLKPTFDEFVRIEVGSEAELRCGLHSHDWHVKNQSQSSWNQSHVQRGHLGNGYWAIEVSRPGRYEIELRRWADHLDQPLEATTARVQIGDLELRKDLQTTDTKAVFVAPLNAGPTRLQGWLTTPEGKERGAYYAYVRRLDEE